MPKVAREPARPPIAACDTPGLDAFDEVTVFVDVDWKRGCCVRMEALADRGADCRMQRTAELALEAARLESMIAVMWRMVWRGIWKVV